VEFTPTARTALGAGAGVYNFIDPRGTVTFSLLEIAEGATVVFQTSQATTMMTLNVVDLLVADSGVLNVGYGQFVSTELTVGYGGTITANSGGHLHDSGSGRGTDGRGATYGGPSGEWNAGIQTEIGCIYHADQFGSGGFSSNGGSGGGFIQFDVIDARIDGTISANGGNAGTGGSSGSGGSIYLKVASDLHGIGTIAATGGESTCDTCGSGASGGRVVIDATGDYGYVGRFSLYGGNGRADKDGSSGTAIINSYPSGFLYRILRIDSAGRNAGVNQLGVNDHKTCASKVDFVFDEVHLGAATTLTTDDASAHSLVIKKLYSTSTSTLVAHQNLDLAVEANLPKGIQARIAANIQLSNGGKLRSASSTAFDGPSNTFAGILANVQRLSMPKSSSNTFAATFRTATYSGGQYTSVQPNSNIKLGALVLG
jgi:hypothetical protein